MKTVPGKKKLFPRVRHLVKRIINIFKAKRDLSLSSPSILMHLWEWLAKEAKSDIILINTHISISFIKQIKSKREFVLKNKRNSSLVLVTSPALGTFGAEETWSHSQGFLLSSAVLRALLLPDCNRESPAEVCSPWPSTKHENSTELRKPQMSVMEEMPSPTVYKIARKGFSLCTYMFSLSWR